MGTLSQLFEADLREDEATRLRLDLEAWRRVLAGPCDHECIEHEEIEHLDEPYNGHRHWTDHYEENRSAVVAINLILEGTYREEVVDNT